ncbi:MAG: C-terminal binding protein [Pirellulales bacterium]|nr:C-terminal binding protein [Pirellulales bacterium]
MARYRVLLTDYAWPDLEIERAALAAIDAELIVAPQRSVDAIRALAPQADAIMTTWMRVPAEVIDAAVHCRIVARLGIGLDNIDVAAATRRGIPVTNVPDYCAIEVAEHTLALLLALARRVAFYHRETKSGRYDLQAGFPLRRIAGQTLGIVGLGTIGQAVVPRAAALGLRIVGTSRTRREVPGVAWLPLDELLQASDFVSLHLPLTPASRQLIDAAALAKLKPEACLLNTARGGLVDHAALAAALAAGQIAGAALDVQDPEPPELSQPPWNDPRVIVTPHAAFASTEAIADLRRRATAAVVACLAGGRPEHVVNRRELGW